jgi:hypothetical protein
VNPAQDYFKEMTKRLEKRTKTKGIQPAYDFWDDLLVYRACLASPKCAALCGTVHDPLRNALRSSSRTGTLVVLELETLEQQARESGATFHIGASSPLLHWVAASPRGIGDSVRPTWLKHENDVLHLPGPGHDTLQFKYPMTGDFRFSVDCFEGAWGDGDIAYGGIVAETHSPFQVTSIAGHETLRRSPTLRRPGFNRLEVRCSQGKVGFYVNQYLAYEEEAGRASPWLMLFSHAPRTAPYRNISITGNPVIPREVPLFAGNRLDGWNTAYFGESQARQRLMAEKPADENDYLSYEQRNEAVDPDWRVQDGVLIGKPSTEAANFAQSWIYYQRPLCDGEKYQYEFFYTPGVAELHPSLGRLAFLLRPSGVELHWIAKRGWDDGVLGMAVDNHLVEADCRRGPAQLPLKGNEWNKVEVTLKENRVHLALNGVEVYDRPMEADGLRLLGMFRDKRHAVKVRSAILTGPWPETIADLKGDYLAASAPPADADRRLLGKFLDDAFAEQDVEKIVNNARASSDEQQRYAALRQWVFPSPDHSSLRLYVSIARSAPTATGMASQPHDGLLCPAVELLEAAVKLNKLAELQQEVEQLAPETDVEKRAKQAMLIFVEMAAGRNDSALSAMKELREMAKNIPASTPRRHRSPEFAVAWLASERAPLKQAAAEFSRQLMQQDRAAATNSHDMDWRRVVNTLTGRAEAAAAWSKADPQQSAAGKLAQWNVVTNRDLKIGSQGASSYEWDARRGEVDYRPSGVHSWLFFQSPLRGKFEVRYVHGTGEYEAIVATYGGEGATPHENLKGVQLVAMPLQRKDATAELKIPLWKGDAEFRAAVDGGKVTTFANGVQIHEETLSPSPSPWLALHSTFIGNTATVNNLRIIGTPEIPEQIDLIETASLSFWRAELYDESVSLDGKNDSAAWRRAGEELVGELRKDRSANPLESLLSYQRPMLEDGTIEYEFYYVPGESEVHPAVGHAAILLQAGGSKLHQLTDGQWECRDLAPDNATALKGAAKSIDLHPNGWNRVKLSLAKDELSITVNDHEVAKRRLEEPPSQRFFGLFRYGDQTKCRVRKLLYCGDWPKSLPALADQELAAANVAASSTAPAAGKTKRRSAIRANHVAYKGAGALR